MILDIKYSHPHTFYLSIGIILLSLGTIPLYQYDFIWSNIPKFKLVFLSGLMVIGVFFIWYGERLWRSKEKEREEMFGIRKDIMKAECELKKLEIDRNKLENDSIRSKKSKEEIKKLEAELKEKELEVEKKIYTLKEKELSTATTASGAIILPFISGAQFNVSGSHVVGSPSWVSNWNLAGIKTCVKCKKQYSSSNPADSSVCLACTSKYF